MKKRLPIILIILIIVGTFIWFKMFKEHPDTTKLMVSGNIEVTDIELGFKVGGRLEHCYVDEGDAVTKGHILARLENDDQKITIALAEANLDRAESVLSELMAGSRPEEINLSYAQVLQADQMLLELNRGSRSQEIETARSDLETAMALKKSAQDQLIQAKEDFERFSILLKKNSISQRDVDLSRTRYNVAFNSVKEAAARVKKARQILSLSKEGPRSEQIEKAKAVLAQAQAQHALVKAGPRSEKIDQARALVTEARQRVKQANLQLSYTELVAPMDGIILSRSAEPGEFFNPSTPVVTLGDLVHPWLRAFVSESNLGRIFLKQKVKVTTDSYQDKTYNGVIAFISSQAEFTPKSVQTFEERVKLMFRIKINLSNPDGELKPGMPADATIFIPVQ